MKVGCIFVDSAEYTEFHIWLANGIHIVSCSLYQISPSIFLFGRLPFFLCVGKVTQKPDSVSRKTISDSFTGGLFLWKILQSILQS